MDSRIDEIERRLALLAAERADLQSELLGLKSLNSGPPSNNDPPVLRASVCGEIPRTEEEQIKLFLRLFRCRETVYAQLWERREKGIKGYSPVCSNEWIRGVCGKPPNGRVKCSECPNQAFRLLDEGAAKAHLEGQVTIGSYAIREDDTCVFLACDFDGFGWLNDALLYQSVAKQMGVEVLIERSRSGNGAHAWIFFSNSIPARLARALGTLILAKCGDENHRVGLDSYDRFFPNQDYLPKGGFGNLIALPLQGKSVELGNTVFVAADGSPLPDQWGHLSQVRRLSTQEVQGLLQRYLPTQDLVPEEDVSLATDKGAIDIGGDIRSCLPSDFSPQITSAAQVHVPLEALPAKLVTALKRLATFPNPEFYKLQRMRMQTYPQPRFIFAGELRHGVLLLPRGLLDQALKTLELAGATPIVVEAQVAGATLDLAFSGTLTAPQEKAINALCRSDSGVLVALPGAGKTVIACALIAKRKVSTLILLHKQPLAEQWKERLATFLRVAPKSIGVLAGTRKKRTGQIDIAMLQTLTRAPDCAEILAQYGLVIVDECHHVPATSFEAVMKQCPAKHVLGLTATPRRKDGLEKLLYLQCGPIRHEMRTGIDGMAKRVIIRETGFRLPEDVGQRPPYHVIAHLLSSDEGRNALISADLAAAIRCGRFPLVLSDRKEQIEALRVSLLNQQIQGFILEGSLSAKKRKAIIADVASARLNGCPVCLFATASLIGEGFDMPELDTLFLTMPLSFEGRLIQYAGRLNRQAPGKTGILVHDYVDSQCAVSLKMYRSRVLTFRKMGYEIESPKRLFGRTDSLQAGLFGD